MLDIELFRNNLEKIIESEEKRFKDPSNAKKVLDYDKKWRDVLKELEELKRQRNEISIQIGKFKKSGEERKFEDAKAKSTKIKEKIDKLEQMEIEYLEQREKYRYIVGNILHQSVPIGETEESNEIIRKAEEEP